MVASRDTRKPECRTRDSAKMSLGVTLESQPVKRAIIKQGSQSGTRSHKMPHSVIRFAISKELQIKNNIHLGREPLKEEEQLQSV